MMRPERVCIRECGGLFSPCGWLTGGGVTFFFPARKQFELARNMVFSGRVRATEVLVV